MTHCDVGISPSMAAATATHPTIAYLCGDYSDSGSASIRDSLTMIADDGRLPAAVDCETCRAVARSLHSGVKLAQARRFARKAAKLPIDKPPGEE